MVKITILLSLHSVNIYCHNKTYCLGICTCFSPKWSVDNSFLFDNYLKDQSSRPQSNVRRMPTGKANCFLCHYHIRSQ